MFKKVKELLDNGSISAEVAGLLDAEIKTELTSLRSESAGWRTKYKELETTFNEVSDSKKSLEEQVTGLDEKIKRAKEDGKLEVIKDLEKEKNEKSELIEKFNNLENTNKSLKIENSLSKSLETYETIDNETVAAVLRMSLNIADNEVKFKDGKTLDEGVKAFFDAKPHLLKAKGNTGSGYQHGAGDNGENQDFVP